MELKAGAAGREGWTQRGVSEAWEEAPCSFLIILAGEGISRLKEDQVKSRKKEEKLEGAVTGEDGRKNGSFWSAQHTERRQAEPTAAPRQAQRPSPSHSWCDQGLNEGGCRGET